MKFNVIQLVILLTVFSSSTIYSVLSEKDKQQLLESIQNAENYEQLKHNFLATVNVYLEKRYQCDAQEQKNMYEQLGKQLEDEYEKQNLRLRLQEQRELHRQQAVQAEQSWSFLKLISPIVG
jgi:hypothetical protein